MSTTKRTLFEYLQDEAERPFFLAAFDGKLDDVQRQAYAEFLDRRDPLRAEWVRLEMKLHAEPTNDVAVIQRYRELSGHVGYDYLRVMRRNNILNCGAGTREPRRVRFSFVCEKRWEVLRPTETAGERHCDACNSRVYHCTTVSEAETHARSGHCIAVSYSLVDRAAGGGYRNAVGRPNPVADWGEKLFPDD